MSVLYHASTNRSLEVLEPQRTISNDKYIGDYVFATDNKLLAALYLAPKGFGIIMRPEENPPVILICATGSEAREKDKGGAIYAVDAEKFRETPQKELAGDELVSKIPVKPLSKEVFDSVFDLWEKLGVKVEFISQDTYDKLVNT